jgi:hypothetical protein
MYYREAAMRSVRFDDDLEARLTHAAEVTGEPVSELIRQAVREKCDEVLGDTLYDRLRGYIGIISVGGDASKSKDEYARALAKKHSRRSRKVATKRKPRR